MQMTTANNLEEYFQKPEKYINDYENHFDQLNLRELQEFVINLNEKTLDNNNIDQFLKLVVALLIFDDLHNIQDLSILCLNFFKEVITEKQLIEKNNKKDKNSLRNKIFNHTLNLIDEEITLLKDDYSKEKFEIINKEFIKFIKVYDTLEELVFLKDSFKETIKILSQQSNIELERRHITRFSPILFSYIMNAKLKLYQRKHSNEIKTITANQNDTDDFLDKINILVWSCALINILDYRGRRKILTEAHVRLSYEIFKAFNTTPGLNNNFHISDLKPCLKIFSKRDVAVPQLNKLVLAKKLQYLQHGYVILNCYYLNHEKLSKREANKLMCYCPYRIYSEKQYSCTREIDQDTPCEFFNERNIWVKDYLPKGINLTQNDLIYLLQSNLPKSTMKKYISGNITNISKDTLKEMVAATGIPEGFFISSGFKSYDGYDIFYYKDKLFMTIFRREVLLLKDKYESLPSESKNVLHATERKLIEQLIDVFDSKKELQDTKIFLKTYNKIQELISTEQ